jgi:hypothetical protein
MNRDNSLKQRDGISTSAKRIVVLLVAVAAAAPPASAGAARSSADQLRRHATAATAQCPCNVGLPGGPLGLTPLRTATLISASSSLCPCNVGLPGGPTAATRLRAASSRSASSSDCPCNVGLPGGPAAARQATLISATVSGPAGRFDWGDAGVGAGFTAGLALLAAAATLVLRRHRAFAGPYS